MGLTTIWIKPNPEECVYRPSPREGVGLRRVPTEDHNEMAVLYKNLEDAYAGDSSFRFRWRNESWRIEVSPSVNGSRVYILRHMMRENDIPTTKEIGVHRVVRERILSQNIRGLILVAGLQGAGKTTFSASLIKDRLTLYGGNVVTIEDPPEIDLDGMYEGRSGICGQVLQIDVRKYDHIPLHARSGEAIASSFRSDTDLLFFGEIRRSSEASELVKAVSGVGLCVTTIHAQNPEGALERLALLMGGSSETNSILGEAISAVIYLKLDTVAPKSVSMGAVESPGTIKRLRMMPLFFNGPGPRSIVKEGRFQDLRSEIERQHNELSQSMG